MLRAARPRRSTSFRRDACGYPKADAANRDARRLASPPNSLSLHPFRFVSSNECCGRATFAFQASVPSAKPTVAHAQIGTGERRLVSQTFARLLDRDVTARLRSLKLRVGRRSAPWLRSIAWAHRPHGAIEGLGHTQQRRALDRRRRNRLHGASGQVAASHPGCLGGVPTGEDSGEGQGGSGASQGTRCPAGGSVREAARIWRVSKSTAARWINAGRLPGDVSVR
jgi:hypothetical protein